MEDCPFVSVIIPVFNDAERLQRCLKTLTQQSYDAARYEIIVIDNGSDQPEKLKAAIAPYNVVLIQETTPGSYAARNRGMALAQGEVLAFTDADCLTEPDWLEKGVAALQQTPNCGQVVGNIRLFFDNPQRPTVVELYERLTAFRQEALLQNFHGGATANVFTWKRVADQVGGFNTRHKSAGDMEWGNRIFLAGYNQVYAADVVVNHPARRSFKALVKRTVRLTGGGYNLCIKPEDSFLQRQKMFARLLVDKFVPPVQFARKVFSDPEIKTLGQQLKLTALSVFLRHVEASELLRLKLGGATARE